MATSLSATVSSLTTYTFVHGLNRLDLSVRLISTDGEIVNNFLSQVIPDPANPKNTLIINFTTAFTGRIQIVTLDLVQVAELVRNSPTAVGIDNLSATTDPSPSNNLLSGYTVGSRWYNTTTQDLYMCILSNIATAQWKWQNNFSKYITLEKTATQGFTTTLSDVTWNTSTQNVSGYFTYASNVVTINRSGDYRITNGLVSISSGGAATSHRTIIVRTRSASDLVLPLSECYRTVEQQVVRTGGLNSFITSFLQNDQIRMRVQVFTGTSSSTAQIEGTYLQIERVG
jgi:hypothetical protein